MFNFHMNSFDAIIENKADFIIKRKDITFKNITKSTANQNKNHKLHMFLEIRHQQNPFKDLKRATSKKIKRLGNEIILQSFIKDIFALI